MKYNKIVEIDKNHHNSEDYSRKLFKKDFIIINFKCR
jgi:hypothetical protein